MRFLIIISLCCLFSGSGRAQDSLRLSRRQADSLFIKNNLLLLAGRFRIEAGQAEIIQASLYDNPTVSVEVSAYNIERQRALDVGRQGQKIISVQQLLYTAGKRNKRIALAQESAKLNEYEFADLLRSLRFELRSRFFELYFQQQTLGRYDRQISTLQSTVTAFERQYDKNNVSLRELLRLKALLFQLNNDRLEIRLRQTENQQVLRTLLSIDQPILPVVDEAQLRQYRLPSQPVDSLRDMALRHRADVLASQSLTRQSELNYNLQKSLAVPDVRVGGTYDQAGSYIPNYLGVSVSMDLPFLNRNQGAIKAARSQINYQKQLQTQKTVQVGNEVLAALQKVQEVEQTVQSVESRFSEQFEQLNQGLFTNFQKHNISLLEFIDLIETYNESTRELNRLKADRISAYEELNYVVGEELFN
ncbi:TolC family protein [Larkinella arboricola]|uniref:Cobalt-zinc-cadmium efflux system outer membrane protein n=1 Tax=Larkinella arboricola TaxID=643671 RepID=A0A327WPT8_LARAB|nr:TolC family protein [Larkinella arboricola]RAJ94378.1 cobalt-zinc-cadmium efflux system outer membrane protein [Larkinella arboricola]